MSDVCPTCGDEYERVSQHWALSSCSRPNLSQYQKELLTGCLMGDGCVHRDSANPRVLVNSTTKEYLDYLSSKLGFLSASVSLQATAAEKAEDNRKRGFREDGSAEKYSDYYVLRTKRHPEIRRFAGWYSSGEKVFPDDLELSPTILKHWYCGDGNLDDHNGSPTVRIACANERHEKDKIERMFSDEGFDVQSWDERERPSGGYICSVKFSADTSRQMIEYMGDPPPGFEYKWIDRYK